MKKLIIISAILIYYTLVSNAQWQQTSFNGEVVGSFSVNGYIIFAGTDFGEIYWSVSNGNSWTLANISIPWGYNIWSMCTSVNNVFAGTDIGIYMSSDNGNNWTITSMTKRVTALAVSGNNIYAGTLSGGVYLSTNSGSNWTATSFADSNFVTEIEINGSSIFVSTYSGKVYLSANNGSTWTAVNNGLPIDTAIFALAVSGNNILAGTHYGGVYLSANNGVSWLSANTGMPANTTVYSFLTTANKIFAGTSYGVFLSINNGNSWIPLNTGLTYPYVYDLCICGNYLYASTPDLFSEGGAVWKFPLSHLEIEEKEENSGITIFPNPTGGNFTLSFQPVPTQIQIINSSGQAVLKKTVDKISELDFTIKDNGIYLIQITTSKGTTTRKLVINH